MSSHYDGSSRRRKDPVRPLKNKVSAGEYLAFLSTKHEVDPDELFYALISAGERQKARCGKLSIECRSTTQDKAIFLIMKDSRVVAQFPVPKAFLLERINPIKDFMKTDMIRRHLNKKNKGSHSFPIRDLRTGMNHISLKAKVLEIPTPKRVVTRFGNYANITNALIADETGTIKLCLWNEQINSISTGDTIQIENARTSRFRGEKQLSIGKKGTLSSTQNLGAQLR
jgi:replication factor A1